MNRIRELREARGWRGQDLADKLHVKKNTISRYEREERQLDPPTIHALCDLFGCTSDFLIGRSNNSLAAFSDDEAALILAFRDADRDIQESIRLQLKLSHAESKKATVAS